MQVMVDGPQVTPVQAGAIRAGVFAFTYHANAAGTYTITATVHGVNVCNSPAVVVASVAEVCASQCEVKGCPISLVSPQLLTLSLGLHVLLPSCLLSLTQVLYHASRKRCFKCVYYGLGTRTA